MNGGQGFDGHPRASGECLLRAQPTNQTRESTRERSFRRDLEVREHHLFGHMSGKRVRTGWGNLHGRASSYRYVADIVWEK
jgi:hypothetical protein